VKTYVARAAVLVLLVVLWVCPAPEGLKPEAWRLFAIFASTIAAVVVNALPILTASVLAVAIAVLTGTLSPANAYSGFANGTILLIVIAFLVARTVISSGLGKRIGFVVVSLFGRSTLGLSYSLFLLDAVIAPAFPSNTARSGVLFPLASSLAEAAGSKPDDPSKRRVGAFLMFSGMASISMSSGLWLTAMAANPLGAEIAKAQGVNIGFGSWLLAASVPTIGGIVLLPVILYKLIGPEVKKTPEAPAQARKSLAELGPMSAHEKIVCVTFIGMVLLWGLAGTFGLDSTAIAFLGLAVLLVTGVLTLKEIGSQGDVLVIFMWFAILFTLSSQLDALGFMDFIGNHLATALGGLSGLAAGVLLIVAYVVLHYLFVSQTAHLLALFAVFLDVGVRLGVPAAPLAYQLLFATNYFSVITPQGGSSNLLFAGSGYLTQGELYKYGAIVTGCSLAIFLVLGLPWLMWVAR